MANRTVRKIKRSKNKEFTESATNAQTDGQPPAIIVTPPEAANKRNDTDRACDKESPSPRNTLSASLDGTTEETDNLVKNNNIHVDCKDKDDLNIDLQHEMKVKSKKNKPVDIKNRHITFEDAIDDEEAKSISIIPQTINNNGINMNRQKQNAPTETNTLQRFDVSQLIAELSQNSKSSSTEIQNIQRKLLQQANEILRENSSANVFQIQGINNQSYALGASNSVINVGSSALQNQPPTQLSHNEPNATNKEIHVLRQEFFKNNQLKSNHHDTGAQMIPEKLQSDRKMPTAQARIGLNPMQASEQAILMSQLGPNSLQMSGTIALNSVAAGHMQRVGPAVGLHASSVFSKVRTGSYEAPQLSANAAASTRAASHQGGVTYDGSHGLSVYAPVPPAYRMPPAPAPALASAAHALEPSMAAPPLPGASNTLHTHSNKFPIEREVILSSCDKNSKIPILHELKKRAGKLGVVAPDAPPKTLAWTHTSMENQQQPGTSNDLSYRQQYHEQTYYSHNTGGAIPRNNGHENNNSQKPPVPGKNISLYATRDQKIDMSPNNSQSITVTVETGKDSTKDAPKSTKSVTKTYHTLKDMISSRFKGKDTSESEKNNESEVGLNNVTEEHRKSTRDSRNLEETRAVTPREVGTRKMEQSIYGRPMPQTRGEPYHQQLGHGSANNLGYSSPSPHQQMLAVQHQMIQQQMLMNQQHALGHGPGASSTPQHKLQQASMMARSQEVLASTPQHGMGRPASQMMEGRHSQLVADGLYQQQYGVAGRRSGIYQRDEGHSVSNFTSLKQTGPQAQYDNSRTKGDMRSPQQLEREIVRQRGLPDNRLTASQPQLDEPQHRPEQSSAQIHDRARRSSHSNLLETIEHPRIHHDELSDDGGFRAHLVAQGRSSFESRNKNAGRPPENNSQRIQQNGGQRQHENEQREHRSVENVHIEKNDENLSQKSVDSVYNSNSKMDSSYTGAPQPAARQTPSRIEDLKGHGKKGPSGSAASSDYDKNGGQSSNVDSGRGSVAYSSGRRPDASLHDTSADSDALGGTGHATDQPSTSKAGPSQGGEPEWVDIVESELRQILEPKMHNLRLDSTGGGTTRPSASSSVSSVTPPLPPLSPGASDSTSRHRRKHQSLPLGSRPEYSEDYRKSRGRESPPRGWQHQHHKQKHPGKREHHSSQYKKHLFGLDNTDITSTTTRSLDLSSMLDGQSDSDVSTQDARAIRRQLQGLENMYCEVLKLLGVRKPTSAHGLGKYQPSDPRLSKRRYGSMSSLPSSSVSSRPVRDKRRSITEHRKKNDLKSINKRFQRLESHVVTLARSVAHLSSEMRTQHLVMQEMDGIRAEIAALRHMYKSQAHLRGQNLLNTSDPQAFSNPDRVKRLTKFFGDEPPLMRLFLKRLGYEKYASLLEAERVGAAELPYVGEDRLRSLGVPLGPRMRILKEAGAHQELHHTTRDRDGNTTTTLAIV